MVVMEAIKTAFRPLPPYSEILRMVLLRVFQEHVIFFDPVAASQNLLLQFFGDITFSSLNYVFFFSLSNYN